MWTRIFEHGDSTRSTELRKGLFSGRFDDPSCRALHAMSDQACCSTGLVSMTVGISWKSVGNQLEIS